MSFLFGGGDEKTTTKQDTMTVPQYPAEAFPLFARELALLTNTLGPLEQAYLKQQMEYMNGGGANSGPMKAARMAGPMVAGGPWASGGGMTGGDLDTALRSILMGLQAQAPNALAAGSRSLLPSQYSGLFSPNQSTQTNIDPGSNSQQEFQNMAALGSLGLGVASAFCWVADALYGEYSGQALAARYWVTMAWKGHTADAFRWVYRRIGPQTASLVKRYKLMRWLVKPLFDHFAERGRWVQVQSFRRIYG